MCARACVCMRRLPKNAPWGEAEDPVSGLQAHSAHVWEKTRGFTLPR